MSLPVGCQNGSAEIKGCRDAYIDLMAGVPEIAADLLQYPSRQSWAQKPTWCHLIDHLVGERE
jgi:hypothetical protein